MSTKARKQQGSSNREHQNSAAQRSNATRVVIAALAVIMALSLLLPSLSAIVSALSSTSSSTTTEVDTSSDETTDDASDEEEEITVATIDALYEDEAAELEASLEDDPTNLVTLLSLGDLYTTWAAEAADYASSDEDAAHIVALYSMSVSYYDQYLALNDSNSVTVSRASALFECGETQDAIDALLERMQGEGASYPPLYLALGMFYEELGETDLAISYYEQAEELDSDDTYGSQTLAQERLAALGVSSDSDE